MEAAARRELNAKAPLVDLAELREVVVSEIMTPTLRDWTDGVWLLGSFVNPGRSIDANGKSSDLDVFVRLPDWDLPQAETGIAMVASEPKEAVPSAVRELADRWEPIEGPASVVWECSVDEAWERIPEPVKRTLVASTKEGFFATESDRRQGTPRCFDFVVGNDAQLEYNRQLERDRGGETLETKLWPREGDE